MPPLEWEEYEIDAAPSKQALLLATVSHVAHVRRAASIIQDGEIRAGLVYDASKLNKDRTLVCWVSPNHWTAGFRYGNVQFTFRWAELVGDKNLYWVEVMREYSPVACRILVTKRDFPASSGLIRYDPGACKGPLRKNKKGEYFWNSNICLEFMIEDDLGLDSLRDIDLVKHHDDYCSERSGYCQHKGKSGSDVAATFMGLLVSWSIRCPQTTAQSRHKTDPLVHGSWARMAVSAIGRSLQVLADRGIPNADAAPATWGSLTSADQAAGSVALALLALFASPTARPHQLRLLAQFQNVNEALEAVAAAMAEYLGENVQTIRGWMDLDDLALLF